VRELQEHGARTAVTAWRRASLVAALAAVLVVVDQLTKTWALRTLTTRDIDLFWTLRFHLARNNGAAFSVGLGSGGLIGLLAIGVVIVLVALGRNLDTRLGVVSLGLVLGGALGNLADRVFRSGSGFLGGRVVDFIDPQWWPIFNVADMAITIGGVLLVLSSYRET